MSLHPFVWSYFGDHQTKLTRSFRPEHWLAEAQGPGHRNSKLVDFYPYLAATFVTVRELLREASTRCR